MSYIRLLAQLVKLRSVQARDDDDFDGEERRRGPRVFREFECPLCNANNPLEDGFTVRDEVFCQYCGATFLALLDSDAALKLREI
jgi:hypothetical protein